MNAPRIYPPTYFLIALLGMLALRFVIPLSVIIPAPWSLLGIVPIGLGIILSAIADRAFRTAGTTVRPYEVSSVLVTEGFYRMTRNPMYLGFALILVGAAMILGTISPFLVVVGFIILIDRIFIRMEEQMLSKRFGDDWRAYAARTGRWI